MLKLYLIKNRKNEKISWHMAGTHTVNCTTLEGGLESWYNGNGVCLPPRRATWHLHVALMFANMLINIVCSTSRTNFRGTSWREDETRQGMLVVWIIVVVCLVTAAGQMSKLWIKNAKVFFFKIYVAKETSEWLKGVSSHLPLPASPIRPRWTFIDCLFSTDYPKSMIFGLF